MFIAVLLLKNLDLRGASRTFNHIMSQHIYQYH